MRFIITGQCICGAQFNKNQEIKDITLNEENLIQFRCDACRAFFNINTRWIKEIVKKTIAQKLDGCHAEIEYKGRVDFDPKTLIHTFEDGSQAKLITRFEEVPAHLTKALSTSTKKEIRYWKALV